LKKFRLIRLGGYISFPELIKSLDILKCFIFNIINLNISVGMTSSEYMNRGGSCNLVQACISSISS
jgi:hypothetical protein